MTIQEKAIQLLKSAVKDDNNCLNCTCFKHSRGYGWVTANKTQMAAHRVIWIAKNGLPPNGLWVLHSCDNRACINIEHLHIGTPSQNNIECVQRGRWKCGTRKLTLNSKIVVEIRKKYGFGKVTQSEIAKQYGVSQTMISRIILKKAWRHAA